MCSMWQLRTLAAVCLLEILARCCLNLVRFLKEIGRSTSQLNVLRRR